MTRTLLCLALLLLAGCAGITTTKVPPSTVYALHAAKMSPVPEPAPGLTRPVLSIPAPAVPPGFDTPQITLYLNNGRQIDYYAGAQWPAALGTMIQNVAIETGRNTLTAAAISEPELNLPYSWKLAITVLDFQPVYHSTPDVSPDLVVSMNFRLIRYPEEIIALDFTLGRTAPGVANNLTTVTGGLENALQLILAEAFARIDQAIAPLSAEKPH